MGDIITLMKTKYIIGIDSQKLLEIIVLNTVMMYSQEWKLYRRRTMVKTPEHDKLVDDYRVALIAGEEEERKFLQNRLDALTSKSLKGFYSRLKSE